MSKPIVAIVGKPNVGKSRFFNYVVGQRISIVEDTPGVTRDRVYADTSWRDREFTLIDTGGIEPESNDIILSQMREQANIAISVADVILFMTNVKEGVTGRCHPSPHTIWRCPRPTPAWPNRHNGSRFRW